jgi:hypothetical protein
MLVSIANLQVANVCQIKSIQVVRSGVNLWTGNSIGPYIIEIAYKGNKISSWDGSGSKTIYSQPLKSKKEGLKLVAVFAKKVNKLCK